MPFRAPGTPRTAGEGPRGLPSSARWNGLSEPSDNGSIPWVASTTNPPSNAPSSASSHDGTKSNLLKLTDPDWLTGCPLIR